MADKAAVAVVKGDWVRLAGSTGPYRRVIGLQRDLRRVRLWLEDPDHPGEPLGGPLAMARTTAVDVQGEQQ